MPDGVWIVVITSLLAAVTLLIVGLRGRRKEDHPLCRNCGYDLTGLSADRCPECGADLTRRRSTRIGHRQRRRGLVGLGVFLLLIGGSGGGPLAWTKVAHFNFTSYKPLWWLGHDMKGSRATRDAAFLELTHRADRLSPAELRPFCDRALALQASPATWDAEGGTLIERVHALGKIDMTRWATYARQAFTFGLSTNPIILAGEPLGFSASVKTAQLNSECFLVEQSIVSLTIDSRAVPILPRKAVSENRRRLRMSAHGFGLYDLDSVKISRRVTRGFSVGIHTATATLQMSVAESNSESMTPRPFSIKMADDWHPFVTFDVPVSMTFVVAPLPLSAVTDESYKPLMEAAIKVDRIVPSNDGHSYELTVHIGRLPLRLADDLFLRKPDGTEIEFSLQLFIPLPGEMQFGQYLDQSELSGVDQVDVVFAPSLRAIEQNNEVTAFWGREVVIYNVPVIAGDKRRK